MHALPAKRATVVATSPLNAYKGMRASPVAARRVAMDFFRPILSTMSAAIPTPGASVRMGVRVGVRVGVRMGVRVRGKSDRATIFRERQSQPMGFSRHVFSK